MDWEQHYIDKHTPWDKGAPAPPLLQWLKKNPTGMSGDVLVPGCGSGHDVRALAKPEIGLENVVGFDLSTSAIAKAEAFEKSGAETYKAGDLFAPAEDMLGAFDWIWEHTCFCAIDPSLRDDYVVSTHALLKPGGQLLGVFYLNPYDSEHQPGGGPPHGTSVEELKQRFVESGKFELIEEYLPTETYSGREGLEWVMRFRRPE